MNLVIKSEKITTKQDCRLRPEGKRQCIMAREKDHRRTCASVLDSRWPLRGWASLDL